MKENEYGTIPGSEVSDAKTVSAQIGNDAKRDAPPRSNGTVMPAKSNGNKDGAYFPPQQKTRNTENSGSGNKATDPKHKKDDKRGFKTAIALVITAAILMFLGVVVLVVRYFNLKGVAETANTLIQKGDYTQAYLIAKKYRATATMDNVAAIATDHFVAEEDYKQAYVFASLIEEQEEIADIAISKILSLGKDAVDSDAFSVARKSESDSRFNSAIISLADSFCEERDYFRALDILQYHRNASERDVLRSKCFIEGSQYYLNELNSWDGAEKFIAAYCYASDGEISGDKDAAEKVINTLLETGETGNAIILSQRYGIDSSSYAVSPGSAGIRSVFHQVYPLLTEEQKRAYHSTPLGYYKEPYVIKDGAIDKTDITDAVSVSCHEFRVSVMRSDGSVTLAPNEYHNETGEIPQDIKGVKVVTGAHHTVILKSDGTCAAFGSNERGQCDVTGWTDIEDIAAGRYFTLGLKSDGTCVACGYNGSGQCDVGDFKNVISIGACDETSVVLFSDGTVRIRGYRSMGIAEANDFTEVTEIKCGDTFVVARLKDGSFRIADGTVEGSAGNAEDLKGCTDFCAGSSSIAYTDSEGTLKYTGDGSPKKNTYYE